MTVRYASATVRLYRIENNNPEKTAWTRKTLKKRRGFVVFPASRAYCDKPGQLGESGQPKVKAEFLDFFFGDNSRF